MSIGYGYMIDGKAEKIDKGETIMRRYHERPDGSIEELWDGPEGWQPKKEEKKKPLTFEEMFEIYESVFGEETCDKEMVRQLYDRTMEHIEKLDNGWWLSESERKESK